MAIGVEQQEEASVIGLVIVEFIAQRSFAIITSVCFEIHGHLLLLPRKLCSSQWLSVCLSVC